jgi:hypothetical protein
MGLLVDPALKFVVTLYSSLFGMRRLREAAGARPRSGAISPLQSERQAPTAS